MESIIEYNSISNQFDSIQNSTPVPEEPMNLELKPCPICSRTFVPETLEKHVNICEKMAVKKRKTFDSSRQRREGTELAGYLPKNFGLPATTQRQHERGISPKPQQIVPPFISPKKPPEGILKPLTSVSNPNTLKKATSPVTNQPTANTTQSQRDRASRAAARNQPPPSEQCPYCERCFGIKAYDRHVEWCKEKALIASIKNGPNPSAAARERERLQARTKYRAPCLKTKRAVNREKYSGAGDDDSNDSHKYSMSTSLNSSFISEGGLSDKYDPFLSAKRQLEELCSPTSSIEKPFPPTTANSFSKQKSCPKMSASLTSSTLSNPKRTLSTVKSNFRRTSSLRSPRKASMVSRPLFVQPTNHRPSTIQRGLSDEGPISSNFLKPEEYDEMPVRSVCVNDFAITNSPRVVRRDLSASNRKNLKLPLSKENSPTPLKATNNLSKTDSLAIFLKYETEAKTLDSPVTAKDLKDKSNTLSKQNSSKNIIDDIQERSEVEKNANTQNANESGVVVNKIHPIRLEPLPKSLFMPKHSTPKQTDKRSNNGPYESQTINLATLLDSKDSSDFIDPKLINDCDNLPIDAKKSSDSDLNSNSTDSDNAANNQTTELDKQFQRQTSASSNRNSTENRNLLKRRMRLGRDQFLYDASPDNEPDEHDTSSTDNGHETSSFELGEKKALNSPDMSQFDDFDFEEFLSTFGNDEEQFPIFKDCREFLMNRSFNKRVNLSKTSTVRSPLTPSPDDTEKFDEIRNPTQNEDQKHEIFISIETDQNDNDPANSRTNSNDDPLNISSNSAAHVEEVDDNDNKFSKIEDDGTHRPTTGRSSFSKGSSSLIDRFPDVKRNNMKNLQQFNDDFMNLESNLLEPDQGLYPIDLDDISSVECFPIRRGGVKSKQSADSAYGSLSRHSPTDNSIHRSSNRTRPSTAATPESMLYHHNPSSTKYSPSPETPNYRNRNFSASSSSGSDNSLPPISQPQKDMEHRTQYRQPMVSSISSASSIGSKMSRFCHECGSKFLIDQAKFCMDCGVKRIML